MHTSQENNPISLPNCHVCVGLYVYSSHSEDSYQEQQWFSWALKHKLCIINPIISWVKNLKVNIYFRFLASYARPNFKNGTKQLSLQAYVVQPTFLFYFVTNQNARYSFPKYRNQVPIQKRKIHLTKLELIWNVW